MTLPEVNPTATLYYAHGGPAGAGAIRVHAEDFQVNEILGYQASGDGEHLFLTVRKQGMTTNEVVALLADYCSVRKRCIGFAGLKDKRAVTIQTFSIQLPGRPDPDWQGLVSKQMQILSSERHRRKIRRGTLRGNRFVLRIREIQADRDLLQARIEAVARHGVPNYFGPQRFGSRGGNLVQARQLFLGELKTLPRPLKGILLSSVRSWLFNMVLSERVGNGTWNKALTGDVMLLNGSNRQFMAEAGDDQLEGRVTQFDIHPSAPLCGKESRSLQALDDAAREERVLAEYGFWVQGLVQFGVAEDRRSTRLLVDELEYEWEQQDLVLSFSLPAGGYATAVLRELLVT